MYKLKKLPYTFDALEPFIDTHTLGLHYHKHQQNYLNKLNELLVKNNYDFKYTIEELPKHINEFNEEDRENILFHLGGVLNHDIYFGSMSPKGTHQMEPFKEIIINTFGSYEQFKKDFKEKAMTLKGSGYTFLVINTSNQLEIINLKNQETPYSYNLIPIMGLDLWEHAYYINYENKKDLYIDNFFEIIDYQSGNELFGKTVSN